ncbi:carboxylesterase family protein [Luteimonas sp. RIT-PG2_3]
MPLRLLLPLFAGWLLMAGCASSDLDRPAPSPADPAADQPHGIGHGDFVAHSLSFEGRTVRYQVFVPMRLEATPIPLVLFLHGSGERGDDNRRQLEAGLGPYLRAHGDRFKALAVFPQAPRHSEWSGDSARMALAVLDDAARFYGADPDRTYLTGMSMGGYGSWELALIAPQRFAAIVPVCGGITAPGHRPTLMVTPVAGGAADPFAATAAALKDLPIWIFHGGDDDVVLPEQSQRMYAALQRQRAGNVHYTELPGVGHNSWDPAYRDQAMWDWLFAQKR